jgi:hypothetical protein
MKLDDLEMIYHKAASSVSFLQYEGPNYRAGIRAVVAALRDEIDRNGSATWTLHQILTSDGVEYTGGMNDLSVSPVKAAGGPTSNDGQASTSALPAPAADKDERK